MYRMKSLMNIELARLTLNIKLKEREYKIMKYIGKIYYTMDKDHPDVRCVKDWTEDKEYSFMDEYDFAEIYDEEDTKCIVNYIKKDLKLIAGGGYNSDHIHNVKFDIHKV